MKIFKELLWDMPIDTININYKTDKKELKNIKEIGNKLGEYFKK